LIQPIGGKWRQLGQSFVSSTKKHEANPEKASFSVDHKTLESVEQKISKSGFNVVVRVVVTSHDKEQAEIHMHNIESSFHQFTSEQNHFEPARILLKPLFMHGFIYRYFPLFNLPLLKQFGVLNSDELATLFHFPNKSIETAHIHWLNAKRAPAPSQIPDSGLFIGKSKYRGVERKIYLGEDDRRRHMYIIGKTGTGKSQLLEEMIIQDIEAGKGVGVVDPHGELIMGILKRIPASRAEDVIYFDPADCWKGKKLFRGESWSFRWATVPKAERFTVFGRNLRTAAAAPTPTNPVGNPPTRVTPSGTPFGSITTRKTRTGAASRPSECVTDWPRVCSWRGFSWWPCGGVFRRGSPGLSKPIR
jgi:hypothetical protein